VNFRPTPRRGPLAEELLAKLRALTAKHSPEALAAVVGVSGPTVRRALKGGVCTPLVARALAELVATTPTEAPQRAA
jgi:hypothetical protein